MTKFKVAVAQLNSDLGVPTANWSRAAERIQQASDQGAQLVVFPECFLQGYRADQQFARTAISEHDPLMQEIRAFVSEQDIWAIIGLARTEETFPHQVYNSAAIVGPGQRFAWYDKIHLGTYLHYTEGVFFAPGRHLSTFTLPFVEIGVQICYDISFPEVSRVLALEGAELNVVLSAGPDQFRDRWDSWLQVRSMENAMWTVYANCVGQQADTHFFGGSRIVGPDGRTRETAAFNCEDLLIAEIDLEEARLIRRSTHRFRDRVPKLYEAISRSACS